MSAAGWFIRKAIGPGDSKAVVPAGPVYEPPPHPFDVIARAENPTGEMWEQKSRLPARTMHLGAVDAGWMTTQHEGHALILGPPRSHAGKTASVMIPAITSTWSLMVSTSTKPDVVRATALARAGRGRVWAYAPDGKTPIPPGLIPLRWSPLQGAEDWDTALSTTRAMTAALKSSDVESGGHWRDRAGDLLAPIFHWAALSRYPMGDARDAANNVAKLVNDPDHPGKTILFGRWIARQLKHYNADPAAVGLLENIMDTQEREQSSIISTAVRALGVYQFSGAIRSTENPNFDPAVFVAGGYGQSTVYIMSSTERQGDVAPLVVAFLSQIRQKTYDAARDAEQARMEGRQGRSPSVVFALDEMYGIAPIPDLANMLSEGGSQGVLVLAAVQDLALIKDRWKTAGESFITLFQDILVLPGIRHGDTLEAVSKLAGDYSHGTPTTSYTSPTTPYAYGVQSSTTEGMTYDRRRILPPEMVARGPVAGNQDVCIHLSSHGVGMVRLTPYWRSSPWPQVLTQAMEAAIANPVPPWTAMGAPGADSLLTDLPCPDLSQWAMEARSYEPWADRYLDLARRWHA